MNKVLAHGVLSGLDVAAFVTLYAKWGEASTLRASILAGEATVELHTALGFWPLVAMLPVIHGLSVMIRVFPALGHQRKLLGNGLVILFLLLLGMGVWVNASFRHLLKGEGYAFCEARSQSMTFSSFEIYLREPARCP